MNALPPITLDAIPAERIAERRAIVARDGCALRGGTHGHTIEIKSLTTNEWLRLALPGGATEFATAADRDAVLRGLHGEGA